MSAGLTSPQNRRRSPGSRSGAPKRRYAVARWVDERQEELRYLFTLNEIASLGLSPRALYASLHRLQEAKRIVSVGERRGLWAIIPAEHRVMGAPPLPWILPDLMVATGLPYYVGLRSAAYWYGATHHAVQTELVVVPKRLRPFTLGRQRLRFIVKTGMERTPARMVQGPVVPIRYSTPEATALDLVRIPTGSGTLSAVAGVLGQMEAQCTPDGMTQALVAAEDAPTAQRLGYLWRITGSHALAEATREWLETRPHRAIALEPESGTEPSIFDPEWKVFVARRPDVSL